MRAFRLAYDGARFHGFQRQPDVPTVEDALFSSLARLDVYDPDGPKPPGYSAAGRTDAGVSALAQTVAFECPDWCSPTAFNAELPAAVRAWASAEVPADFHATRDARRREYVYHLHAPGADDERLRTAAERLAGTHDYRHLTPDSRNTVRDLAIDVDRDDEFAVVTVSADGFPRQLVRRLVSLLADVGTGERSLEAVGRVFEPAGLPDHEGVPPAPAHPLVLSAVDYDVAFAADADAATATSTRFSARRVEFAARSRVARQIADGL